MALLLSAFSLFAQNITLTFTGRDVNNQFIPLHRVVIMDETQNWQESIYYPDTIYTTSSVGIEDHNANFSFALSQNVPNPFEGETDFSLQMPKAGRVQLDVNSLNGQRITTYSQELPVGIHTFRVQLSTPQGYVLNARSGQESASIKMLNTGNAGTDKIQYLGDGQPLTIQLKSDKGQGSYAFQPGDQMSYIGYFIKDGVEYRSQHIQQQQFVSENFVLNFNLSDGGLPCLGMPTLTDYDGNIYHTVQIGNQCWMKENLKTTHYSDGTAIEMGTNWNSSVAYRYCPDDNCDNVYAYGYLYNRPAVMHGANYSNYVPSFVQGVCPAGWHVPSYAEWEQLQYYVNSHSEYLCDDSSYSIAKALASTGGWNSSSLLCDVGNDPNSNNATGFSALPAGSREPTGYNNYNAFGNSACFWTATKFDYMEGLYYNGAGVHEIMSEGNVAGDGFSVRCLRDEKGVAVITTAFTDVTQTTAVCGGKVLVTDVPAVTARGVCWSTSQQPTISDAHTTDGAGAGTFTSTLTGLSEGTTYYVRAYATNSDSTTYGNPLTFTTTIYNNDGQPCPSADTVTDYDGNIYHTVQIGNQCWMKENLKTTHYSDGTAIPVGNNANSGFDAYRYYPNNNSAYVSTYGYLYNWPAVMKEASSSSSNLSGVQGICPDGWHVPSDSEWTQLTDYVASQFNYLCGGYSSVAAEIAKALASTSGWNSSASDCAIGNNLSNNNATGFTALPAGSRNYGNTGDFGKSACFWSATRYTLPSSIYAYARELNYNYSVVTSYDFYTANGYSVRCLKD